MTTGAVLATGAAIVLTGTAAADPEDEPDRFGWSSEEQGRSSIAGAASDPEPPEFDPPGTRDTAPISVAVPSDSSRDPSDDTALSGRPDPFPGIGTPRPAGTTGLEGAGRPLRPAGAVTPPRPSGHVRKPSGTTSHARWPGSRGPRPTVVPPTQQVDDSAAGRHRPPALADRTTTPHTPQDRAEPPTPVAPDANRTPGQDVDPPRTAVDRDGGRSSIPVQDDRALDRSDRPAGAGGLASTRTDPASTDGGVSTRPVEPTGTTSSGSGGAVPQERPPRGMWWPKDPYKDSSALIIRSYTDLGREAPHPNRAAVVEHLRGAGAEALSALRNSTYRIENDTDRSRAATDVARQVRDLALASPRLSRQRLGELFPTLTDEELRRLPPGREQRRARATSERNAAKQQLASTISGLTSPEISCWLVCQDGQARVLDGIVIGNQSDGGVGWDTPLTHRILDGVFDDTPLQWAELVHLHPGTQRPHLSRGDLRAMTHLDGRQLGALDLGYRAPLHITSVDLLTGTRVSARAEVLADEWADLGLPRTWWVAPEITAAGPGPVADSFRLYELDPPDEPRHTASANTRRPLPMDIATEGAGAETEQLIDDIVAFTPEDTAAVRSAEADRAAFDARLSALPPHGARSPGTTAPPTDDPSPGGSSPGERRADREAPPATAGYDLWTARPGPADGGVGTGGGGVVGAPLVERGGAGDRSGQVRWTVDGAGLGSIGPIDPEPVSAAGGAGPRVRWGRIGRDVLAGVGTEGVEALIEAPFLFGGQAAQARLQSTGVLPRSPGDDRPFDRIGSNSWVGFVDNVGVDLGTGVTASCAVGAAASIPAAGAGCIPAALISAPFALGDALNENLPGRFTREEEARALSARVGSAVSGVLGERGREVVRSAGGAVWGAANAVTGGWFERGRVEQEAERAQILDTTRRMRQDVLSWGRARGWSAQRLAAVGSAPAEWVWEVYEREVVPVVEVARVMNPQPPQEPLSQGVRQDLAETRGGPAPAAVVLPTPGGRGARGGSVVAPSLLRGAGEPMRPAAVTGAPVVADRPEVRVGLPDVPSPALLSIGGSAAGGALGAEARDSELGRRSAPVVDPLTPRGLGDVARGALQSLSRASAGSDRPAATASPDTDRDPTPIRTPLAVAGPVLGAGGGSTAARTPTPAPRPDPAPTVVQRVQDTIRSTAGAVQDGLEQAAGAALGVFTGGGR